VTARFDSEQWHAAVARLVRGGDGLQQADALIDLVACAVDHEGTCLLAFHRDAPPDILHHTLDAAGARHYLDRYIAGPYLLDPLFQLALRKPKPAVCRFREESPDRFRSSEYYRQYCERTHLLDEMDFLLEINDSTTLALVIGRRTRIFSKAEVARLRRITDTVQAAMQNIWDRWVERQDTSRGDSNVHERLTRTFESFGADRLTRREREISKLLLRGHSTKSIARELDIAPGTVMVHKRNLFAKLDITSQYALFSLFIQELSRY
jgi:DNA-binding CsgD family transcriptional regulator